MNDIFKLRGKQTYNLRKHSQFYRPKVNSVYNGTESVSFFEPIIRDFVPNQLKDIGNLTAFKKAIKKWSLEKYPFRFCKYYISKFGSIFKKRARWGIFPVQKTPKCNRVSNIARNFFLIGIHSIQGWRATTRHRVTRKRSTKKLKHTGNLFKKNLQLKDVC